MSVAAVSVVTDPNGTSSDEYLVTFTDASNNKSVTPRSFNEFIHFGKLLNKEVPSAKLELPVRGAKAIFQKLNKKFYKYRLDTLDRLMKHVVASKQIMQHESVSKFLYGPKGSGNGRLPSSTSEYSFSSETQIIGDISLGVTESKLTPTDFTYIMQIGKGSFGRVYLATMNGQSNKYYAIKTLEKKKILQKNETDHINCERRVLIDNLKHPFLVSLKYSFQTVDKLYFVLDYVNGGELFFHLQRDRTFPESRAKFYSAEIGSAIGYMHERQLIYRDLKPENILLNSDGHVKLTDFGLCKDNMKAGTTTDTFCGTPEYLAPEVLKKQPYTRSIDWWCLGAVTYEMVYGLPPFYSRAVDEMYRGILYKPLKLPTSVSSEMRDFLQQVLQKNPKERLGHGESDWEEIKCHKFFRDISWEKLHAKKIPPPFIPNLNGPTDGKYIEASFRNSPIPNSVNQAAAGTLGPDNPFDGFTFENQFSPLSFSLRESRQANFENFSEVF